MLINGTTVGFVRLSINDKCLFIDDIDDVNPVYLNT